jgi:hypothetical protein
MNNKKRERLLRKKNKRIFNSFDEDLLEFGKRLSVVASNYYTIKECLDRVKKNDG